ncbi:hypothetical protein ROJ8625_00518 [Roseivivax jejudonensis]|uniref:Uncharacterized protein n=1 Tax=Roseivivax jejudonensis TaxID=1529041 RepID=A0A1X6YB13_9RHOB|nr:hypothetical protein [Roseivivax jejudonensis]SLN15833.1 hypothetical protein ROJ8625_00518 [Roseivivax jejudonensis]
MAGGVEGCLRARRRGVAAGLAVVSSPLARGVSGVFGEVATVLVAGSDVDAALVPDPLPFDGVEVDDAVLALSADDVVLVALAPVALPAVPVAFGSSLLGVAAFASSVGLATGSLAGVEADAFCAEAEDAEDPPDFALAAAAFALAVEAFALPADVFALSLDVFAEDAFGAALRAVLAAAFAVLAALLEVVARPPLAADLAVGSLFAVVSARSAGAFAAGACPALVPAARAGETSARRGVLAAARGALAVALGAGAAAARGVSRAGATPHRLCICAAGRPQIIRLP